MCNGISEQPARAFAQHCGGGEVRIISLRILISFTLVLFQSSVVGQVIADCIEIISKDSLKFYFKSHGILVNRKCADFYRVAKMHQAVYVFNGRSKDYYSTGELAVDCNYGFKVFRGFQIQVEHFVAIRVLANPPVERGFGNVIKNVF
jgi:hypothetical protein